MAMNGNGNGAAAAEDMNEDDNGAAAPVNDVVLLPEDVAEWLEEEANRTELYNYLTGLVAKNLGKEMFLLMSRNQISYVLKALNEENQWEAVCDIVEELVIHDELSKLAINMILKNAKEAPEHDLPKLVIEDILKNEADPMSTLNAAVEDLPDIREYVGEKLYFDPKDNHGETLIDLPIRGTIRGPNAEQEMLLKGSVRAMKKTAAFFVLYLFHNYAAVSTEMKHVTKLLCRMGLSVDEVDEIFKEAKEADTKVQELEASLA